MAQVFTPLSYRLIATPVGLAFEACWPAKAYNQLEFSSYSFLNNSQRTPRVTQGLPLIDRPLMNNTVDAHQILLLEVKAL